MKKLITIIIFVIIVLLGTFLRIYNLGETPKGMLVDEPSLGYNAYSILKTGKDEYGTKFPIVFKSFGDYKLPGYIYASIIPIKLFGLNTFSTRFISMFSGIMLIIVMYYLLKEIGFNYSLRIIGMLITAVSPWTIILSRFAWESNLGLFIFSLGLLFLLRSKKKTYFLIPAGIFLGLSSYCYHPYLFISVSISVFFGIYGIFFHKLKLKNILYIFIPLIIIILPLLLILFSKDGTKRFKQTNIFTNPQNAVIVNENRTYCESGKKNILCYLISNKPLEYIKTISNNYVDVLSIKYLFMSGETEKFLSVENIGFMPHILLFFYILGWIFLITRSNDHLSSIKPLIMVGIFLSAFPSVITGPQRIRLSPLYPFILILIMMGFVYVNTRIKSLKNIYLPILSLMLITFGFVYIFYYTHIHAKKYELEWNFSEDIMKYISMQDYKSRIYIDDLLSEPIMYYAFYNKIDPSQYQKSITLGKADDIGFQHVTNLNNVFFIQDSIYSIACKYKSSNDQILYVTNKKLEDIHIPTHIIKTSNGVYSKIFFYNLEDRTFFNNNCL